MRTSTLLLPKESTETHTYTTCPCIYWWVRLKKITWAAKWEVKHKIFMPVDINLLYSWMWHRVVCIHWTGRQVRPKHRVHLHEATPQKNLPKYNQDVRYQVLTKGDQVRCQCIPFQLTVIERKCDTLLSKHIGFHPSVLLPPTLRIHIHLSTILHIICTVCPDRYSMSWQCRFIN